jgi:hypothetical protein
VQARHPQRLPSVIVRREERVMRRPESGDLVWNIMLGILDAALVLGMIGATLRDVPVVGRLVRPSRA